MAGPATRTGCYCRRVIPLLVVLWMLALVVFGQHFSGRKKRDGQQQPKSSGRARDPSALSDALSNLAISSVRGALPHFIVGDADDMDFLDTPALVKGSAGGGAAPPAKRLASKKAAAPADGEGTRASADGDAAAAAVKARADSDAAKLRAAVAETLRVETARIKGAEAAEAAARVAAEETAARAAAAAVAQAAAEKAVAAKAETKKLANAAAAAAAAATALLEDGGGEIRPPYSIDNLPWPTVLPGDFITNARSANLRLSARELDPAPPPFAPGERAFVSMAAGNEAAKLAVVMVQSLRDVATQDGIEIVMLLVRGGVGSPECHDDEWKKAQGRQGIACSSNEAIAEEIISPQYCETLRRLGVVLKVVNPIERTQYTAGIPGGGATFWGMSLNR